MLDLIPPKVIHLRIANIRKRDFQLFLAKVWEQIESLSIDYKLINVYLDRIEAFR
jgi:predicted nuclease of predicted toxin-antitoxin system